MSAATIFLDYAAEYASMGLAVFPLMPRSKHPFKGTNGFLNATTDLDEIAKMAAGVPNAGIGIAPGASGLFVLDKDPRNGGDEALAALPPLPETLTTTTGRGDGGNHFWFKRPATLDEVTCTSVGPGLDIKGLHSGYVVAPPSIHPDSGCPYEWSNTSPIAEPPEWLVKKILAAGEARKEHAALSMPVEADSFLLGRAFGKMSWLGPQIKNGVFAVLCPNQSLHDKGKPFDSGTVIFAHENGGIGTFFCSHTSHCIGLGKNILNYFPLDLITERDCTELAARCKETDLGNAERLGLRHGNQIRYNKPLRTWFFWTGKQWKEDSAKVQELAKAMSRAIWKEIDVLEAFLLVDDDNKKKGRRAVHAKNSESAPRIQAAMSLAGSAHVVDVDELDADPWLFNVQNGTIDLRTGWLRPHRREDLITKIAACDYDPDARSEIWEKFLREATGGDTELAAYLQRAVGCAVVGEAQEKAFWFIYGPTDCGKSTFITAVSVPFGDYFVSSDADTFLARQQVGGNRGDVVRLRGSRLTTVVELPKGAKFDEKLVKKVTGGDPIDGAAKFKDEITFKPTFSLWFAANDCPTIRDDDDSMWGRVRRIPFTTKPPKIDKKLRQKLTEPDVQRAILTWAVRGCLEWQRTGLGTCKAVEASSSEYRKENDRLADFFDDVCVFAPEVEIARKILYSTYRAWCDVEDTRALNSKAFAERVRNHLGVNEKKYAGERGWIGIRPKTPAEQVAHTEHTNGGGEGKVAAMALVLPFPTPTPR
jgi:putative DNA primase/helicase